MEPSVDEEIIKKVKYMNYWDDNNKPEEFGSNNYNMEENEYRTSESNNNYNNNYNIEGSEYRTSESNNNYNNNYNMEGSEYRTSESSNNYNTNYIGERDYNYGYNPNRGLNQSPSSRAGKKKKVSYVTKKGFVIGIICSMLATSGLTIGGLSLAGAFDRAAQSPGTTNTISATNYTLAAATGTQKSIEEIVAMNENAVVEIQTETVITDSWMMNYITQGAGSGVIVDSNGYILTCNHVIEGAKSIVVTTKDGVTHDAVLVGSDSMSDVAVLKIDGTGYTAATYGDSSNLSVGDLAVAIGNPLGKLGGSASTGIISSLDRELEVDGKLMTLLQTDASINPGNSGGGLFNGEGNLIGIVVAKSTGSDVEGIGFAIPINDAAAIAKELIENGKVTGRPLIGVSVIDASDAAVAKEYGYSIPGLYIYEVSSKNAEEAGLMAGDMITAVNGEKLSSRTDLTTEINKYSPGDTITLTIVRENKTMDIDTVLIDSND